jgi:glycosyltransferase involved in cell wall biosynthesis
MDYRANVDAVTEFTRAVLPLLRTRLPNVQFWIVGSKPAREVLALAADAAVHVTGFVSDTRPYLRHAAVVVAPLRMARGMQNKVLEALAIGQPVVATTHVLRGFDRDAVPGMVVADTAETMAQITGDLLASADTARSLGARARAFVYEHFGWRRSLDTLLTVIEGSV